MTELIIYEISTKNFTSPNGPESGTFVSTKDKISYLQELGVNALWLTGHNWSHPNHFYNIWTQYAVIRPDVLEPSLGTEEDFRDLISIAHKHGIKVFLDVITHGLMTESPIVKEHPEWFRDGTWGMTDFDWYGDHPDLDQWWKDTWIRYVTDFGIDGYRLDVSMYRPDLWWQIKQACKQKGREIVIFNECGPARRGVVDFLQMGIRYRDTTEHFSATNQIMMRLPEILKKSERNNNIAGFIVKIEATNGSVWTNGMKESRQIRICDAYLEQEKDILPPPKFPFSSDQIVLKISGFDTAAEIKNITVTPCDTCSPGTFGVTKWTLVEDITADYRLSYTWDDDTLVLKFPQHLPAKTYLTLQGSCHDDGWDGFPVGENPYVGGKSRYFFGYGLMMAPAIPIFMSGHEFAADFVPLPHLTPGLFGNGTPGKGTWLYGSWIQWDQLLDPAKAAMLEDAKALIHLRKALSDLIYPMQAGEIHKSFFEITDFYPSELPTPYGYLSEKRIVLVAGNPYDSEKELVIRLPWDREGFPQAQVYRVSSLWTSHESFFVKTGSDLTLEVQADGLPRGGVGIWEITPTGMEENKDD